MDEMTWRALHVAIGRTAGFDFADAWDQAGEPPSTVEETHRRLAQFCDRIDEPLRASASG